jgi:hypothetical protein
MFPKENIGSPYMGNGMDIGQPKANVHNSVIVHIAILLEIKKNIF